MWGYVVLFFKAKDGRRSKRFVETMRSRNTFYTFSRNSIKLYASKHKNYERHRRVSCISCFNFWVGLLVICTLTFSPPAHVRNGFTLMYREKTCMYIHRWAVSIVRGNENSWRWRHCVSRKQVTNWSVNISAASHFQVIYILGRLLLRQNMFDCSIYGCLNYCLCQYFSMNTINILLLTGSMSPL
jgi:hypothetical protein